MADASYFTGFGLDGALKQIAANPALGDALKAVIAASGLEAADKATGNLLFTVAGSLPDARAPRRAFIARYIGDGKLRSTAQVNAAIDFFKKKAPDAEVDAAEFERACGVGINFTEEQIRGRAREVVAGVRDALVSARYLYPPASLLPVLKEGDWRWADGKALKEAFDAEILALLGPKNAEDEAREAEARAAAKKAGAKPAPGKAATGGDAPAAAPAAAAGGGGAAPAEGASGGAAAPAAHRVDASETVFAARELEAARNSPRLLEEHLAVTKGVVRTRFPPEPNGFLHIGHAKSMNLNFEGAFKYVGAEKGATIFRYDDTNPDAETQEYIDNQAENVAWMGWKPVMVTHSSDYFPQLYDFAVRLIRMGKAYVCHQTKEDMEVSREAARNKDEKGACSPWRDRPVEESVAEFEAMRMGRYEEGKAVLRLKIDMMSPNPTLWDPVAYRIKYTPHPHTGTAWCIYPSYDFSHGIIDSLEHIDYSLCTLEFEVRRDLYYWPLVQLDIWRPHVWEFARLNVTHVQLSKRKILKLVMEGKVRGWDDPRIPTINGLRRRGYTAAAINAFCRDIGVTRTENMVDHKRLEHHVRTDLDQIARRDFVVLRPLKVTLVNVPEDFHAELSAPDFPRDALLGNHSLSLTRTLWIEEEDFRDEDDPSYFGLAPGKTAGLRYAGYVKVVDVVRDAAGKAVELRAEYDGERSAAAGKVKGNLHWVSEAHPGAGPSPVEVRLYDHLFTTVVPGSTGDWESEINPASEVVLPGAYANPSLAAPGRFKLWEHFQMERVGYFVADKDSDFAAGRLVLNLTVSLKEAAEAKKVRGVK